MLRQVKFAEIAENTAKCDSFIAICGIVCYNLTSFAARR